MKRRYRDCCCDIDGTYGNPLLLATTEHVHPIGHSIPATVPLLDVSQFDEVEIREQVVVVNSFAHHVFVGIRINHLVAQRTQSHVGPLRNVEQLAQSRFGQSATKHRPKLNDTNAVIDHQRARRRARDSYLSQNSEQRRFAATIWPAYKHVHSRMDFERHVFNQHVAVGRYQGYVFEMDNVVLVDDPTSSGNQGRSH